MLAAPKALTTVGATSVMVRLAFAAAALLPFEVCSAPAAIVLVYVPPSVPVTSTWKVQVPGVRPTAAGIERPTGSVTEFAPVVTAPAPVHVVLAFGVPAIARPAGSVSVSAAESVAALEFALVSVTVSVEVPPEAIGLVPKAFATVGAAAFTVSVLGVTVALFKFAVPVMLAALLV